MSSGPRFVQRGATPSRRELAQLSRVPVPQTLLKREPTRSTPWDTDSSVADTTFSGSGPMQSRDMQEEYEYEEDEVDDGGVFQEHLHSPPNHEVPNELLNMDARRPQGRWNATRASHYIQQELPPYTSANQPPQVLAAAQGHLSTFIAAHSKVSTFSQNPPLTQKRVSPVRHIDDSDGDDDEPTTHQARRNQKSLKKNHSLKPAGPRSVSRSESGSFSHQSDASDRQQSGPVGAQLPIQTKGSLSTFHTKSFANHAGHERQEAALPSNYHGQSQPIKKLELERKLFTSAPTNARPEELQTPGDGVHEEIPESPECDVEASEDEQKMNIKQSQSQQTLHELPLQQTDTFDITDASAAVDDVEASDSQSLIRANLERTPQPTKKRGLDLDYPPDTLSAMKFNDLQSQPFDIDPSSITNNSIPDLADLDLPRKLAILLGKSEEIRRAFFANLATDEWEDCGEWFVTQFGQLVKKMNEARRERTRVAKGYEDQVAERYKIVEASAQALAQGLQEMKAGGLGVLKGRN